MTLILTILPGYPETLVLTLSIIALLAGPVVFTWAQRMPQARQLLNLLLQVAIAYIIIVHIVPEVWQLAGIHAIIVLIVGVLFPIALERVFRKVHDTAHLVIVLIAALGLLLHTSIDGCGIGLGRGWRTGLGHRSASPAGRHCRVVADTAEFRKARCQHRIRHDDRRHLRRLLLRHDDHQPGGIACRHTVAGIRRRFTRACRPVWRFAPALTVAQHRVRSRPGIVHDRTATRPHRCR